MKASAIARGARALAASLLMLSLPGSARPPYAQTTPEPTPARNARAEPRRRRPRPPRRRRPPSATPQPAPRAPATGQTLDLTSRPAAYFEGKADRDEVYSAIMGSIAMVHNELDKGGSRRPGSRSPFFWRPTTTASRYRAEVPIDAIPEGKTQLSDIVKFGQTPVGKAMKFEHRGAYDDIDATYEAITAYLDEKGIDAQEVFVEEYLNDIKTTDDPNLQVDIYVLLK